MSFETRYAAMKRQQRENLANTPEALSERLREARILAAVQAEFEDEAHALCQALDTDGISDMLRRREDRIRALRADPMF